MAYRASGSWHLVQEWAYPNSADPVAIHGREENDRGQKRCRWRLPNGSYDDGLSGLKLSDLPLYNACLLDKRPMERVYLVEGEPAADAAAAQGLLAVSLCGGAAQKDFGNALSALTGREVVLCPDNDEPGRTLMDRVGRVLTSIATDLKVLTLAGLPEKGDLKDWFEAGNTPEELEQLAGRAPSWVPSSTVGPNSPRTVDQWLADEDEALDVVIGDGSGGAILPLDGRGFLAGSTGIGKTNLLLRLTRCLAEGTPILGRYPVSTPRTVLYVALEGSRRGMRKRLKKVWDGAVGDSRSRFLLVFTQLNLASEDGVAELERLIVETGADVVILDPLRNAHTLDENDSRDMAMLTSTIDRLIAEHGCAFIAAHHDRKKPPMTKRDSGTDRIRGSTVLAGWLSFCISIEKDKKPDVLILEWTKVRDAEDVLDDLTLSFDREQIDFAATVRSAASKVSVDDVVTAVFHAGPDGVRGSTLVEVVRAATQAGERTVKDRIRDLVRDNRLLEFIADEDSRSKAKSYRLRDEED